ncbi:GDYXXLXY domain-containing protein [Rhizobium sp. RAF56]|jgi:uncharacterized membrane-anchored protein|uniref:GDYXXLXY domain-containing protein n=1 Tax=Rhizobium sp. RAF56 TaxID=3233062 RepID=UPI003F9CBA32
MMLTSEITGIRFARRIWIAAIVVAGLQTAVLGYMVGQSIWILRSGTEVLLKTAPIDPTDLLRGDYVTLNYDISSVPVSTLVGGPPSEDLSDQILSVRLAKGEDGFWSVVESSFGTLEPKPDTVILKSLPSNYSQVSAGTTMRVTYGIERYYVPEGKGRDLEEARNEHRVSIAARVSPEGTAQIRSLLLDGQSVYDEPLY